MARYPTSRVALAAGIAITALTACGGPRVLSGACQQVFDGDICTWGTMVGDEITEFGATVSLTTVENAIWQGS